MDKNNDGEYLFDSVVCIDINYIMDLDEFKILDSNKEIDNLMISTNKMCPLFD